MKTVTVRINDSSNIEDAAKRIAELSGVLSVYRDGNTLQVTCGERLPQSAITNAVDRFGMRPVVENEHPGMF